MNPGQLRDPVIIETLTTKRGRSGGVVSVWGNPVKIWAKKSDQGGREFRAAGQLNAETTSIFLIRYRNDLTANQHRFICRGRAYDLISINEGRFKWELLVEAAVSEKDQVQVYGGSITDNARKAITDDASAAIVAGVRVVADPVDPSLITDNDLSPVTDDDSDPIVAGPLPDSEVTDGLSMTDKSGNAITDLSGAAITSK